MKIVFVGFYLTMCCLLFTSCGKSGEKLYKEFQKVYVENDSTFTLEAFKLLEKSAELHFPEALYTLGKYYKDEEDSETKSIMYFQEAAKYNHSKSQYIISDYYDAESNDSLSLYWLKRSAENGYSEAQYDLADYYDDEDDELNYIYWLKKAVEGDNLDAIEDLADYYQKKDSINAMMELYDKGIMLGSSRMYYLKSLFFMRMDKREKAFELMKCAADKGFDPAVSLLGYFYYYGYGVDEDAKKAFNLLNVDGSKFQLTLLGLARCYYYGKGTSRNYVKAFSSLKSVLHDYRYNTLSLDHLGEAQYLYGLCFYYGKGTTENVDSAYHWIQKSISNNYEPARNFLNQEFVK